MGLFGDLQIAAYAPIVHAVLGGTWGDTGIVGGTDLGALPPEYIQVFTYTRKAEDTGNELEFSIIDRNFVTATGLILKNGTDNPIFFQYGFNQGLMSDWYEMMLYEANPTFTGAFLSWSLKARSPVVHKLSEMAESKAFDKPIDQIVTEVAKGSGNIELDIEGTSRILSYDDLTSTDPKDRIVLQTNETPIQFIRRMTKSAVSDEEESKGGYRFWISDKAGKPVVHFRRLPDAGGTNPRRYVMLCADQSQTPSDVLSYTPSIKGDMLLQMGSGGVDIDFQDPVHLSPLRVSADTSSKAFVSGANPMFVESKPRSEEKNQYGRSLVLPFDNKQHAMAYARALFDKLKDMQYEADLEIICDPTLVPGTEWAEVFVVLPTGLLHWTSGKFRMMEITDTLQGGSLVSQIKLNERSGLEGADIYLRSLEKGSGISTPTSVA